MKVDWTVISHYITQLFSSWMVGRSCIMSLGLKGLKDSTMFEKNDIVPAMRRYNPYPWPVLCNVLFIIWMWMFLLRYKFVGSIQHNSEKCVLEVNKSCTMASWVQCNIFTPKIPISLIECCEWWKYPHFSIADINSLKPVTAKADLEKQMLDRAGDWVTVACDWLLRLVTKGLGKRVELLCLKPEEEVEVCCAYGSWVLCINCDLCASQCMPRMVAISILNFFLFVYDKDHTCMSALWIKNGSERDLCRSLS